MSSVYRATACIGALLCLAAHAGAAWAGFVAVDGSSYVYVAVDGETNELGVSLENAKYVFVDSTGVVPTGAAATSACAVTAPGRVECSTANINDLLIKTGDQDDLVIVSAPLPTTACLGAGNDQMLGGPLRNEVTGGAGDDLLLGGPDPDVFFADYDCDTEKTEASTGNAFQDSGGPDLVVGGEGDDLILAGPGNDVILGRGGNDDLRGEDGDDLVVGFAGVDVVDGGGGNDQLAGGGGNDRLLGGEGNDELGFTTFWAMPAADLFAITVENGEDTFDGGAGDDVLDAGPGSQSIRVPENAFPPIEESAASNGADTFTGGPGLDHVTYVNRAAPVAVSINALADDGGAGEHDQVADDVEWITGGSRADHLQGAAGNDRLEGGRDADVIAGGDGNDRLEGGDNDEARDELHGEGGDDSLAGGPGDDLLDGAGGLDTLSGGGGDDELDGGSEDDELGGDRGRDRLRGGPGADTIAGGEDVDTADYSSSARAVTASLDGQRNDGEAGEDLLLDLESVTGGAGADTLVGDGGANELMGGPGDDLIDGGRGLDRVGGGPGRDVLLAREGARDEVACGADFDLAVVDVVDEVEPGGSAGCDRVDDGQDDGPHARRDVVVSPQGCRVAILVPGAVRLAAVDTRLLAPLRSRVDATGCRAKLTAATGSRLGRARGTVSGGTFVVDQTGRRTSLVTQLRLAGGDFSHCGAPTHVVRRLALRARGAFRVRGRFGSGAAVGRNATWTVEDRCDGTLVRVKSGRVELSVKRQGKRVRVARGRPFRIPRPRTHG
jgi:Ca2+-binding RTX toxin-like protein